MNIYKRIIESTELDVKTPIPLFFGFFFLLSLLAFVSQQFPFDSEVFGGNLTKHVSDIMSEHETRKSLFVLSVLTIILGFLKNIIKLIGIKISEFVNKYFFISLTNFLISLVFVELGVTASVALMAPKIHEVATFVLIYLVGRNFTLAAFLVTSLIVLNGTDNLSISYLRRISVASILTAIYFYMLSH